MEKIKKRKAGGLKMYLELIIQLKPTLNKQINKHPLRTGTKFKPSV